MRTLCFTVDLDRDVNDAVPGSVSAVSLDRGAGNAPRFDSTGKGAEIIAELLDDLGIKATFFAEARALKMSGASSSLSGHEVALHGLDHEDFSGLKTGVHLDEGDMRGIIEKAISMIRDCVGYQPKGFRFPYMTADDTVMSFLPEYGMNYDSSYYAYANEGARPYRLENGMLEIPVAKGLDPKGKNITAYLWPMHEGSRVPQEMIDLGKQVDDGVLVLATHTWHMCESRKTGKMDADSVKANTDNVRTVIEGLLDEGFEARTMSEAEASFCDRALYTSRLVR